MGITPPDYGDARFGLAQAAFRRGEIARARAQLDAIPPEQAQTADVALLDGRLALAEGDPALAEALFARAGAAKDAGAAPLIALGDLRRARGDEPGALAAYRGAAAREPGSAEAAARLAAPAPRRWRLDLGGNVSDLGSGRGDWSERIGSLSREVSPGTAVGVRLRHARRSGIDDLQLEARLDRRVSPAVAVYALVAATPDADFLPRVSFGGGGGVRPVADAGGAGRVAFNLDLRHDRYASGEVTTLSPWVQVFAPDDRASVSLRWVHSRDDDSATSDGYVLRADWAATGRLGLFAGYADAPEIDGGDISETRTAFGGATLALNDALILRADVAHESRESFERDTFGLGLSMRF